MFDESSTFMGSLGRYSNGGSGYDRSIYNELWEGPFLFCRNLANKAYIIQNARLNICLLGHASEFVKYMHDERTSKDDGLIQRVLCSAPMPSYIDWEEVKSARRIDINYSLTVFLYIIQRCHRRYKINIITNEAENFYLKYEFDNDSEVEYGKYYSKFKHLAKKLNNKRSVFIM